MTGPPLPPFLHVIPPGRYPSKEAVIEAIGDAMLAAAAVTPIYVDGMRRKEQEANTMVTADVALPHGTVDVRDAVLRNALVIAPIPDGVEWAPARQVRLAIGLAGRGDNAHLRLLGCVARVLADDALLSRLKAASDSSVLPALFDLSGVNA